MTICGRASRQLTLPAAGNTLDHRNVHSLSITIIENGGRGEGPTARKSG